MMDYRKYNPEKDKEAACRIWLEVGWTEKDNHKSMDFLLEKANAIVADVNGEPECLVISHFGDIDYLGERLKFSGITGVTTSLIARKLKLAARLTATRIALDAIEGAAVSGLGMFEQGYYDKLGYGTCNYIHVIHFSPVSLNVDVTPRVPQRIVKDDWEKAHQSRLERIRAHGSLNFTDPTTSKAEMFEDKSGFGFGYYNNNGELTHIIWMDGLGKEQGPFSVHWLAYQNYDQLKELLALIKSFSDQIHLVKMIEPPHTQMQDFLEKPFQYRNLTEQSKFKNVNRAAAHYQVRICNLEKCLDVTHLNCESFQFNLELTDPIEKYLDDDIGWKGISGNYIVTLGSESNVEKGNDKKLPTLKASVGAFSRMWLGVLPASVLSFSDDLTAPEELLNKLDIAFRLPAPTFDWEF